MARIELSKFIAASREQVWEVLADLEHQADWMVDVRRLDIITPNTSGVGAVVRVTSELFGQPIVRDVMEVVSWEPPGLMVVEHRGQFHGTGEFRLDAAENGTIFTWVEDFRAPLGRLGELAFAFVIRPHLERVFARSMENVARLATAPVSAA